MIGKVLFEKQQPYKPKPVAIETVIPMKHGLFYAYHKKHAKKTFNPGHNCVESRYIMGTEETLLEVDSVT